MKRFNIRIYAVIINERNEVLLSKESHENRNFTKFPGGGIEWGEGTKDCLIREFHEEFNLNIEVGELFYLTDIFQLSAFSNNEQVISIYYRVKADTNLLDPMVKQPVGEEELMWVSLAELSSESVTFPIDKIVVSMILEEK